MKRVRTAILRVGKAFVRRPMFRWMDGVNTVEGKRNDWKSLYGWKFQWPSEVSYTGCDCNYVSGIFGQNYGPENFTLNQVFFDGSISPALSGAGDFYPLSRDGFITTTSFLTGIDNECFAAAAFPANCQNISTAGNEVTGLNVNTTGGLTDASWNFTTIWQENAGTYPSLR